MPKCRFHPKPKLFGSPLQPRTIGKTILRSRFAGGQPSASNRGKNNRFKKAGRPNPLPKKGGERDTKSISHKESCHLT